MPRNRFFRIVASVMSVWLAICLAEPMQLHTCVMHGGLSIDVGKHSVASTVSSHPLADSPHHDVAEHSHGQRGNDSHSGHCGCLGDCSTGKAPIAILGGPSALDVPAIYANGVVFAYASPSFDAPRYLLPFSNGPPAPSSRA